MLKPRIRYIGLGIEYQWKCEGYRGAAYGGTPEDAYANWKTNRRQVKSGGIRWARTKRENAERRIKAREDRRRVAEIRKGVDSHMEDILARESRRRIGFWERMLG